MASIKRSIEDVDTSLPKRLRDESAPMNQVIFESKLKSVLLGVGRIERPDGSKPYIETKQGAFENLKRLLVDAICSENNIDKQKIINIINEMSLANGLSVFDLLWVDQKASTLVAVLNFILELYQDELWESFELLSGLEKSEHFINCLMMVEHKGYEKVVDAVCNFLNHPSAAYPTDGMAHIITEAFKRLELESVPIERLIKLAKHVTFVRSDDPEEEQQMLDTITLSGANKFMDMLSYLVKYGNYDLFFFFFEQYTHLIHREYSGGRLAFITMLCLSTRYAHIPGWVELEKREAFLLALFSHKVFGKKDPSQSNYLACIITVCSEWSMKLLMRVQDLFNPPVFIDTFSFKDYRVRFAYKREESINRLVKSFKTPFELQQDENKLLLGEILNRIDELMKKKVAKDVIPNILSYEFMAHYPSTKKGSDEMIKFLVAERTRPAEVMPVDISRFGLA